MRELSIRLFQKAMGLVVGAEKKKMKKVVWDSLLPLVFHLCCFVPAVLQGARNDASPLVSSLATQTLLILSRRRLSSRFSLQHLSLRLPRAWMRWR